MDSPCAPGQSVNGPVPAARVLQTRKPLLLLLLFGLLLLRFATRQLLALLFQLPPRFTRFDPLLLSLPQIMAQFLQARSGIGNSAEGDHALHRCGHRIAAG